MILKNFRNVSISILSSRDPYNIVTDTFRNAVILSNIDRTGKLLGE